VFSAVFVDVFRQYFAADGKKIKKNKNVYLVLQNKNYQF